MRQVIIQDKKCHLQLMEAHWNSLEVICIQIPIATQLSVIDESLSKETHFFQFCSKLNSISNNLHIKKIKQLKLSCFISASDRFSQPQILSKASTIPRNSTQQQVLRQGGVIHPRRQNPIETSNLEFDQSNQSCDHFELL